MDFVSNIRNPRGLGGLPVFGDLSTWTAWLVFAKALYGLAMDAKELELFRTHTGRQAPLPGGYREGVAIVGVQSGKTRLASAILTHEALFGESGTHALMIGQDMRGAMRTQMRYAREPFEQLPAFRAEVARSTAESIELKNGVSLSAYPCRPEAVRGVRACIVVVDELAFFTATDGRPTDTEMLRVARGRVATTGGKVVILSSPYGQSGALWNLYRQHYGVDASTTLVWQASAPAMNPTLSADYLAKAAEDPDAESSEVHGQFRAGVSNFFEPDALRACVSEGVRERAPSLLTSQYFAFADAASGSGEDSFALAIGHGENEMAVLDLVRSWKPPFSPSDVIGEASDVLRTFGLREVTGDRYAPGFVDEAFRANAVTYRHAEQDRSALYLELLPSVNARRVVLLEHSELLRELCGLERRRGTAGRDRVDHRPGAHDDLANVAAGALVLAGAHQRKPFTGAWNTAGNHPQWGKWNGLEWRGGKPWSGVMPPDRDPKGRPLNRPAIFREGRIVGFA